MSAPLLRATSPRCDSKTCLSRMYASKGNSNSWPRGLTSLIDLHFESIEFSGASIMSIHLTRGRSLTISSFSGKYSPQRTGFPRSFFFSKTLTFRPFSAKWTAAERPPGPPPTTITSYLRPDKLTDQLLDSVAEEVSTRFMGLAKCRTDHGNHVYNKGRVGSMEIS